MKPQLCDGQSGFGGLLRTPKPAMVEVLSFAGYDCVVLDTEHDAHRYEALDTLILTAHPHDFTQIMRANENCPVSGDGKIPTGAALAETAR
jgi:2-keto-3-deoxy-L-rhamnonate aldolase RhmA